MFSMPFFLDNQLMRRGIDLENAFLLNSFLWALLPLLSFLLISSFFSPILSRTSSSIFFSFSSLPMKITFHFSLGFISILIPKVSVGLSATSLASCTSRFFIVASVLFLCDSVLCMNCTNNSSILVVSSCRLGSWLGGW